MNLTVVFVTARKSPCIGWFLDSLYRQQKTGDDIKVIAVDLYHKGVVTSGNVTVTEPKPTVWQGNHRLTKENWWATSSALNTGICLCKTEWVAFQDDRAVLLPGWLDCIREAQSGKYAVFGSYEKRHGMKVENGVIVHGGIVTGEDSRKKYVMEHRAGAAPTPAPGEWCFGCTLALPLEWMLQINGWDEMCDGLSMQDVCGGLMLANNGFDLRYDHRMAIVEDRTPDQCGDVMIRKDKGASPNDKSHALLAMLRGRKKAGHKFDLRQVRNTILAGGDWPKPWGPTVDFWDSQPLSEM